MKNSKVKLIEGLQTSCCELISMKGCLDDLHVKLKSKGSGSQFEVVFSSVAASKVSSGQIPKGYNIPKKGTLFEIEDSKWSKDYSENSHFGLLRHFIVRSQKEYVELLANKVKCR